MKYIRPRLTTEDMNLIIAALRARRAATTGMREHRIDRLITRLAENSRGNPKWAIDEFGQTHEEDLNDSGDE